MSADERDVRGLLGDKAWKKIISAASSGRIDGQQMRDLAWVLPTNREFDRIGANHVRRMNEKGTFPDENEMKRILVDWLKFGNMPENRGDTLEVLINAFDGNINPLAKDLRDIKSEVIYIYDLEVVENIGGKPGIFCFNDLPEAKDKHRSRSL